LKSVKFRIKSNVKKKRTEKMKKDFRCIINGIRQIRQEKKIKKKKDRKRFGV